MGLVPSSWNTIGFYNFVKFTHSAKSRTAQLKLGSKIYAIKFNVVHDFVLVGLKLEAMGQHTRTLIQPLLKHVYCDMIDSVMICSVSTM
jgi:hypothetical protein